jgi:hypothetical protein
MRNIANFQLKDSLGVRWVFQRVLVLWLIMLALCGVIVLVVRLNRMPGPLQALGLSLCDGEPCFRGIKPGIALAEVSKRLPAVRDNGPFLELPLDGIDFGYAIFMESREGSTVASISISGVMQTIPITPGQMVSFYGPPCRVVLVEESGIQLRLEMRYPGMSVGYIINDYYQLDGRLELDMFAEKFWILSAESDPCNEDTPTIGTWHGFTSGAVYLTRNRRALGVK